jgi:hypothetical protein
VASDNHPGRDAVTELAELSSEFASVAVSVDDDGNGPRLKIVDLRTGHVGFLDPLELETLAWLPEGGLYKLLDPSFHRWRDPQADPEPNEGWEQ